MANLSKALHTSLYVAFCTFSLFAYSQGDGEVEDKEEETRVPPTRQPPPESVGEPKADVLSQYVQPLIEGSKISEVPYPILVALAAGFVTLLLVLLYRKGARGRGKQNSVLLMGPINGGKTTLFLQMKAGSSCNGTVTSMEENEDTFVPYLGRDSDKPMHFVDLPGHPRLIDKFEKYIDGTVGVIFVIDSTDFIPQTREIAEQLYALLSHPEFYARRIPLMIACNKMDLGAKAHTEHFIEKRLQKEVDGIRSTHKSLDGESDGAPVGRPDAAFTFQDLKSKVGISKISAKNGGDEVKPIYDFLNLLRT